MLVVMRPDGGPDTIQAVFERLHAANLEGHLSSGDERTAIGAVGCVVDPEIRTTIGTMAGVDSVVPISAVADVDTVTRYADILQIRARNLQNYNLLDEVGLVRKPVMLKRDLSGTIEEWRWPPSTSWPRATTK